MTPETSTSHPRVRVKICGIRTPEDARAAAHAGADAIGLNFVAGPRRVSPAEAIAILKAISPHLTTVGLVAAASVSPAILDLLLAHRVGWLQWYGEWDGQTVRDFRRRGFRTIRVVHVGETPDVQLAGLRDDEPADALLFDAPTTDGRAGGTGTTLDWHALAIAQTAARLSPATRTILAGGLTPENVAEAIRTVLPWAVDVSSGVESRPGVKDAGRMADFVAAVRTASPSASPPRGAGTNS